MKGNPRGGRSAASPRRWFSILNSPAAAATGASTCSRGSRRARGRQGVLRTGPTIRSQLYIRTASSRAAADIVKEDVRERERAGHRRAPGARGRVGDPRRVSPGDRFGRRSCCARQRGRQPRRAARGDRLQASKHFALARARATRVNDRSPRKANRAMQPLPLRSGDSAARRANGTHDRTRWIRTGARRLAGSRTPKRPQGRAGLTQLKRWQDLRAALWTRVAEDCTCSTWRTPRGAPQGAHSRGRPWSTRAWRRRSRRLPRDARPGLPLPPRRAQARLPRNTSRGARLRRTSTNWAGGIERVGHGEVEPVRFRATSRSLALQIHPRPRPEVIGPGCARRSKPPSSCDLASRYAASSGRSLSRSAVVSSAFKDKEHASPSSDSCCSLRYPSHHDEGRRRAGPRDSTCSRTAAQS